MNETQKAELAEFPRIQNVASTFSLNSLGSKCEKQSVSSPICGGNVKGNDDFETCPMILGEMNCSYCLLPYCKVHQMTRRLAPFLLIRYRPCFFKR
ncbi:unnamed protein product [Soboliphyme baturini]|uniref:AN1-type domain-containing protein n=1 Tax=Soboliphyme baturini TaxID=241478 RepID=A0A183JBB3_9BILA|nr:unnamed protein product [Soboliphyme baturini]